MTVPSRPRWRGPSLIASVVLAAGVAVVAHQALGTAHQRVLKVKLTSGSGPGQNLDSVASPMWQTNNTVWSLAYAGGVVYAGGAFTSVRPPGEPLGTDENPVTYLTSFNSSTGAWTGWAPQISGGIVDAVAVSPDGSTLYVGGTFTEADGAYHDHVAAFDLQTGQVIPSFKASAGSEVKSIAVSPDGGTVYLGGDFGKVDDVPRTDAAAVNSASSPSPGAVTSFDPVLDGSVATIAVAPDDSRVLIGGWFTTFNGATMQALASANPATGASEPWANDIIPNVPGCVSDTKDIIISGTTAYIADEGTGPGCFDGDWAADVETGQLIWQNDCLGATQALEIVNGWLYKGSHAHDCAFSPGGFPQVENPSGTGWVTHHLLDQSLSDGSLGHFSADTNAPGGVEPLGPGTMTTDGTQLFVGGDFTSVDNRNQQGLTRFAPGPDQTKPTQPPAPVVTAPYGGAVQVSFPASSDTADGTLTYNIYRSGTANAIATLQATSWPWSLPVLHYVDSGVTVGQSYTYRVSASNGTNSSAYSPWSTPVTVSASNPAQSYDSTVENLHPSFFWPLSDPPGSSTAGDLSGNNAPGTYETSGVTPGAQASGPIVGSADTAPTFNGSSGLVSSQSSMNAPSAFTVEGWFETTSKDGGKILGFGNQQTGWSTEYDRHVYMMNDGQLVFGVESGQIEAIESPDAYNDGNWHFFAATLDPTAGMALYVDGQLVGTNPTTTAENYVGYWRVGGDNLNGGWNLDPWGGNSQGTTEPLSYYFAGSIADVAEFPDALSQAQVQAQYNAALYPGLNAQHHTPMTLKQASPNHGSTPVGAAYTGQLHLANSPPRGGSITFTMTSGDSPVTVNQTGTVTAPANTPPGSYTVTGTDRDMIGDRGTWTFTLQVDEAPKIISADTAVMRVGKRGTFTVRTTGFPAAAVSEKGAMPKGLRLKNDGKGIATISGKPAAGSGGSYRLTITARNRVSPRATQAFTLTVRQAPKITSARAATFTVGRPGTFTIHTTGFPAAFITEKGSMPQGLSFKFKKNGSAVITGRPSGRTGTFRITINARNRIGTVTQRLAIKVVRKTGGSTRTARR